MAIQHIHPFSHPRFPLPIRSSTEAAGYDLHCVETIVIEPGERKVVRTGIRVFLPFGTYGRLTHRSGIESHGIDIISDVIDRDFHGEVKVELANNGKTSFSFVIGSRICQLICEQIKQPSNLCFIYEIEIMSVLNR